MAAIVVIALLAGFVMGNFSATGQLIGKPPANIVVNTTQPVQPPVQPPTEPDRVTVSLDDDPVIGDKNAPVTIVEFSDFQCPFCARFFTQTLPELEKEYISTGKVKLVYRDFPLNSIHPEAQKAAEAAECADEQGKWKGMHDKIFQNQQTLSVSSYKQWAKDLGLNAEQFNTCLDSSKYKDEIAKDLSDGTSYGVRGTPSFFVNGVILRGAQPFSSFKTLIDQELAK